MEQSHSSMVTVEEEENFPTLLKFMASTELTGFDSIAGTETSKFENLEDDESQPSGHRRKHSVSMPSSPIEVAREDGHQSSIFLDGDGAPDCGAIDGMKAKQVKFHSQPMPKGCAAERPPDTVNFNYYRPGIKKLKDRRFDSFKTWSGKLERQLSNLRGKPNENEGEVRNADINQALPVDRYFDALEGPELETLRTSEEIVLPDDKKWPFLLRFSITSFGICLGVSSQAIMWKALGTANSTKFLHISLKVNLILWFISIALVAIVSSIYLLRVILYFEAVRREYYHPIRVNFFFAPWIALLFLALGLPPSIATNLPHALWYILMTPIFCLELKIYGQWMSGGQRRLSRVANPSNHLSIIGNFVGALLGASMGLKEGPIFFFSVGLAHYTVLFVTLYQRLPTNPTLPKELHPVFFLFVAAPSVASMAWAKIQGSFDYGSRITYFISLFLYLSLAVRVNFFRGFKFSLAWWAYTFPMTGAAIATIRYSSEVTTVVTQALSCILSVIATLTVSALLLTTLLHAFVFGNLFPNDIAIAISEKRPKRHNKWFPSRHGSSDHQRNIENFLKFVDANLHDIEAGSKNPTENVSEFEVNERK